LAIAFLLISLIAEDFSVMMICQGGKQNFLGGLGIRDWENWGQLFQSGNN
jgi:hypothetical protein